MLTVRGVYKDGQITLLDKYLPINEGNVLVTFLDEDVNLLAQKRHDMVVEYIHESHFGLTTREYEILQFAQKGLKTQQIAEILGLSDGSVRNFLTSVYSKLKAENRADAVSKAIALGLLDPIEDTSAEV